MKPSAAGEKLETSAQLWLSVRHVTLPTPSTFTALWQVRVERVEGIEAAETMCVVLSATSAGSSKGCRLCRRPGLSSFRWQADDEPQEPRAFEGRAAVEGGLRIPAGSSALASRARVRNGMTQGQEKDRLAEAS